MVSNKTVDYVFKMADVSGEGQITFDEWRSLFENIIKDTMREQELSDESQLDWKKAIMLKIEEGMRREGYQLLDLYKLMDTDENAEITINEFRNLFNRLRIELDGQQIMNLFKDIDKDNSNSIEYNEVLNYVREAKREQERIQRQVQIRERAERLRGSSTQSGSGGAGGNDNEDAMHMGVSSAVQGGGQ